MNTLVEMLLSFLFPQERRASRVARITPENLASLLEPRTNVFEDLRVLSLGSYQNSSIRDLIWTLKYENNMEACRLLAPFLLDAILEDASDIEQFNTQKLVLVPIPLTPARLRERGFNQSQRLACEIEQMGNGSVELAPGILVRTIDTAPQTSLNRINRQRNVRGVFRVPIPEAIYGRELVLIDDVVTTGSTLTEAAKVLHQAGARSVTGLVIARAN